MEKKGISLSNHKHHHVLIFGLVIGIIGAALTYISFASTKSFTNVLEVNQSTFETPTNLGWEEAGNATFEQSTERAKDGSGSLKIFASSEGAYGDESGTARVQTLRAPDGITVSPGEEYAGEAYARSQTGDLSARCEIRWYDSNDGIISTETNGSMKDLSTSRWKKLSCEGTAPSNARQAAIRIFVEGITLDEDALYVDTVRFGYYEDDSNQIADSTKYAQLLSANQTDFEGDRHNWRVNKNAAIKLSSDLARTGNGSLQATISQEPEVASAAPNTSRFTAPSTSTDFERGDEFAGAVWVRSTEDTEAIVNCSIIFKLDSGKYSTTHGTRVAVSTDRWTIAQCDAEVPNNATNTYLTTYVRNAADGDVIYVDDAGLWNLSNVTTNMPPVETTVEVCRDGAPVMINESDRSATDSDPPCEADEPEIPTPTEIDVCRNGEEITINEDDRRGSDTDAPCPVLPGPSTGIDAIDLNGSNTGIVGGIAAGECSGNPNSPYSGLKKYSTVYLDEAWVRSNGSRVFENFDVSGTIHVRADNITIRCGRAVTGGNYTVQLRSSPRVNNISFEWVEAHQQNNGKVFLGGNYSIFRSDISGGEDGLHINFGEVYINETYVHHQNRIGSDPHTDAVQGTSGGSVTLIDIQSSKLISRYKNQNAAAQMNAPVDKFVINESYLYGGAYSVLGDKGAPGKITNNYFAWDSSQFGAIGGVTATTNSGNVWWEWVNPDCGNFSPCETPSTHAGNGTPIAPIFCRIAPASVTDDRSYPHCAPDQQ